MRGGACAEPLQKVSLPYAPPTKPSAPPSLLLRPRPARSPSLALPMPGLLPRPLPTPRAAQGREPWQGLHSAWGGGTEGVPSAKATLGAHQRHLAHRRDWPAMCWGGRRWWAPSKAPASPSRREVAPTRVPSRILHAQPRRLACAQFPSQGACAVCWGRGGGFSQVASTRCLQGLGRGTGRGGGP